jgi:hypothetical protein
MEFRTSLEAEAMTSSRGLAWVFTQAAEDVFDIDDGVVDDHADGDGEAAEGHGVHADAEGI